MSAAPTPSPPERTTAGDIDVEQVETLLGPLRAAWDSSPALVAVTFGPRHVLVYQNETSMRLVGRRPLGRPMTESFPELPETAMVVPDEVLRSGVAAVMPRQPVGVRSAAGNELVLQYVIAPLGRDAPCPGLVMTAVDVTGEVRAERAALRAELVARLAERMSVADDPDAALQSLTDELVPVVADIAAIYVTAPEGSAGQPRTEQGASPAAISIAPGLLTLAGPPPPPAPREGPSPYDAALATGRTVLIDVDDYGRTDESTDLPTASWMLRAHARNLAVVPLLVARDLTGALVLLAAGDRAPYDDADTQFLESVAARAGAAVAHVRAYQLQQRTALDLQHALLPQAPPPMPGVEVSARYVAGADDVEVGGDWWDVHHLGAGRVGIGVGDVSGRGIPAAVLMGQARSGMQAAAHADLAPVDILSILDAQLTELVGGTDPAKAPEPEGQRHHLLGKFATAAYAVIEPFDETLRIANAGHPPFVVRRPGEAAVPITAVPGAPLGVGTGGYAELTVPFPPGSLLVAFTDGLVESRSTDVDSGVAAVCAAVDAADRDEPLDALADRLLECATGADDTALVLVRRAATSHPPGRLRVRVTSSAEVGPVRRAIRDLVAQRVPGLVEPVEQVVGELIANSVEHAGPPVDVRALVTDERVVLEVTDSSASRPVAGQADPEDERGRGLGIVAAYAQSWGSRITRHGKATWAELHQH